MIFKYRIYYRLFFKQADDHEGFDRVTTESAFSAADALTQVRTRLDWENRREWEGKPVSYAGTKAYEITKIEPIERMANS
jgi:hypothetical protein